MAWIEIHDTLPDHPKVLRAAKALRMDPDALVGKLVRLWTWALNNRMDGVLNELDVDRLNVLLQSALKASKLLETLVEQRLLDPIGDGCYYIHDWDEHVSMLYNDRERKRKQSADRVKRYRDSRKSADVTLNVTQDVTQMSVTCNAGCNADESVTCNACNARTVPNHTIDDHLDDPVCQTTARARGRKRAALPPETTGDVAEAARIAEEVTGSKASEAQAVSLAQCMGAEGGMSPEMVRKALEMSVLYGAMQPVAYAVIVLQTWRRNGLYTVEAVQQWEEDRKNGVYPGD